MRARIFEVVQYERNPKTGEDLKFGLDQIAAGLAHKSIKDWAYIRHDRDPFTQHDWDEYVKREGEEPPWKVGDLKIPHWHVVGRCQSAIEVEAIARWFAVPVQQVEIPRGRDAWLDKIEYLTHEDTKQQALGKAIYEDSEVTANFDFRQQLTDRAEKRAKFGHDVSEKDEIRYSVLREGLTLRDLADTNPIAYQNDYATLDKFRLKYISQYSEMPKTRINYYVCGRGGIGKGLICRALARSLYPDKSNDDDIFFEVGAKGAAFEGYDGQPVIIWNDRRAADLLQELGNRGNVFNVFDTHPTRGRQNIKYGSVNLCNEVNIVNSVQPYIEFLDGLAGNYKDKSGEVHEAEDKGQSYRRFPFIIPLHEEDFDLLMNKGFYEGTNEFMQYISYKNIRGNMQRIAEVCAGNEKKARIMEKKTLSIVKKKHDELCSRELKPRYTEEQIDKMLEGYGEQATATLATESADAPRPRRKDGHEKRNG